MNKKSINNSEKIKLQQSLNISRAKINYALVLSRYVRTRPLFNALNIKSVEKLYYKFKLNENII